MTKEIKIIVMKGAIYELFVYTSKLLVYPNISDMKKLYAVL